MRGLDHAYLVRGNSLACDPPDYPIIQNHELERCCKCGAPCEELYKDPYGSRDKYCQPCHEPIQQEYDNVMGYHWQKQQEAMEEGRARR